MKITFKAFIKDLMALLAGIFVFFVFLGALLVYSETGNFSFHWNTLKYVLSENVHYLLIAIALLAVAMFALINYFWWVLSQRKNCQIQYVDLSQIATKWLEYNEVEKNIRDEVSSSLFLADQEQNKETAHNEIFSRLLNIQSLRVKDFVRDYVIPHTNSFDTYETKIVFDLLEMIDSQGEIPSVASLYERDPEIQTYKDKAITLDGKTSYDILSEYTLVDHTIRVAETMLALNSLKTGQLDMQLMYSRMVIAALAHDIGKIKVKDQTIKITGEMYHKTPHDHIGAMMFQEMYPDYRFLKIILEAIRSHHLYKVESSISSLLKEADKKAREIEIGDWLIRRKEGIPSQSEELQDDASAIAHPVDVQHNVTSVPKEVAVSSKRVQKKEHKTENEVKYEFDFVEAHIEKLISILREKVNIVEKNDISRDEKIVSINFGDQVLYDYMFFKKTLETIVVSRLGKDQLTSIFLQLQKYGLIKLVEIEKGFLVSRFIVQSAGKNEELSFVPIDALHLGLTASELDDTKRAHPILRSVVVMTYRGGNNQLGEER